MHRFHDQRRLASVDSTNRYLMDLARAGAPEGVVVVADHQSAGRGRRGRTWVAPAGTSLLVSVLARPDPATLPPSRWWLLTAAMALAAAETCGTGVELKWPNDLLLGERKLAGILAEAEGAPAGAVVIGIGINVSWSPPGAAALGAGVDRDVLLDVLLGQLDQWWDRWDDVDASYRRRCATVGRQVRVELDGRVLVGRAVAIGADGALAVETAAGRQTFLAGDVVHVADP